MISKILDFVKKHSLLTIFLVYGAGFLFWNIHLGRFGFFEYNFIQVRYISAGMLFWLPIVFGTFLVESFLKNPRHFKVFTYLAISWFITLYFIFHLIPQSYGGAKPNIASIIGTPDQINYLGNFGIRPAANSGASVQTFPLCVLYTNNDYILISNSSEVPVQGQITSNFKFSPRLMSISRENFIGLHTMDASYGKVQCKLSKIAFGPFKRLLSRKVDDAKTIIVNP